MDFDDLLLSWRLMTLDSDLEKIFARKWEYILVDEYQDTNTLQAEIVFNLSKSHQNVLVVGDDAKYIFFSSGKYPKHFRFSQSFSAMSDI